MSLRAYGSWSRGDHDELSDIDVLAVYARAPSAAEREIVGRKVRDAFDGRVDLAEYSRPRIETFYRQGHLFAWHLYKESTNLATTRDVFFDGLGEPMPYAQADQDAHDFSLLLRTSRDEISKEGASLIYEAGLMYLASRNVAICASYSLDENPDFSRWAVYNIAEQLGVRFELAREDYGQLIKCRFASIRDQSCDAPAHHWLREVNATLIRTCDHVVNAVFRRS